MQSFPPHFGVREDERFHIDHSLAHHIHQTYDAAWNPIDPALRNIHYESQQKHPNHSFVYFQQPSMPYYPQMQHMHGVLPVADPLTAWRDPIDAARNMRYDSPGGHYGGSMSEASSDYAISPVLTRQQTAYNNNYFSPRSESHLSQQSWTTNESYLGTPASTPTMLTPTGIQPSSIAMKELEFQGNPEFQLDLQEDDIRGQIQYNVPEELELSYSTATLTTSTDSNANRSAQSVHSTDSSVSSPAQERDSDSDFDPKQRMPKSTISTRALPVRLLRRSSSSSSSFHTLDAKSRVHKPTNSRSSLSKEKSKPQALPQLNSTHTNGVTRSPKSFPCTFHNFGCSSTFANKNEWKRHVTSQHLQLGFYRCDLGTCNPDNNIKLHPHQSYGAGPGGRGRSYNKRRSSSTIQLEDEDELYEVKIYNDFNRKDLFTQHCRRMHGPARHLLDSTTRTNQNLNARLRAQGRKITNSSGKAMSTKDDEAAFEEELGEIRTRCWTLRRYAPERSSCGFCGKLFEASAFTSDHDHADGKAEERAWEERMEHLGRHYERDGCSPSMEGTDQDLVDWGLREEILYETDEGVTRLVGYDQTTSKLEDDLCEGTTKRRGPRRKASIAVERRKDEKRDRIQQYTAVKEEVSDEDAMAEDDYIVVSPSLS